MVTRLLDDGIHIGLDEGIYHDDPALGSTDLQKLRRNPYNFWWGSTMNPRRPKRTDSPAIESGRAVHCCVLEGQEAFEQRYTRGEDNEEMTPAQKAAATKAGKKAAAEIGKILLPAETYDRVLITSAMITKNPHLSTAFSGGLPEVSIFWTRDGIRRKGRLDYLKPRGIGDLKNVSNPMDIDFGKACYTRLGNQNGEIQAVHYLEGRSWLKHYFREGQFFAPEGLPLVDFLEKCALTETYAFQWVFFQSEGAPITFSRILSLPNPIVETARREIEVATDNYKRCMDLWGPDEMWVPQDAPEELDQNDMPGWWGRN